MPRLASKSSQWILWVQPPQKESQCLKVLWSIAWAEGTTTAQHSVASLLEWSGCQRSLTALDALSAALQTSGRGGSHFSCGFHLQCKAKHSALSVGNKAQETSMSQVSHIVTGRGKR
mmetsp:Transcript_16642/g.39054  ORF Transcript_16642/g.39054 Transcript_16642/m.39054 type:complete len:117 (+) Transcript_16642:114-464(+)